MRPIKVFLLVAITQISFLTVSIGQQIETLVLEIVGEDVKMTFKITPEHSERERYDVLIYSSHDNYTSPLNTKVSDVIPNQRTTVVFPILESIGYFQGEVQFKLVANSTYFPVRLSKSTTRKFRKNKEFQIVWEDYNELGSYQIDLYQNDSLMITLAKDFIGNDFSGKFPKGVKPGKYTLVVSPSDDIALRSDDYRVSVTRNITTIVALSAVLVGTTGYFILQGEGGSGGDSSGGDSLPDPPGSPN